MKQKKIIYFIAFLLSLSFIFWLEASSLKLLTEDIKPLRREEVKIELLSVSKNLSEENEEPETEEKKQTETAVKTQKSQEKQEEDNLKKINEINEEVDNNSLEKERKAITPEKNKSNVKEKSETKDQKELNTEETNKLEKDQDKPPAWLKNTESENKKDNSKNKNLKARDEENKKDKFDLEKYLAELKKEDEKNKESQTESKQNLEQINLNKNTTSETKKTKMAETIKENQSIEKVEINNSNNSEAEENNQKIKENKVYDLRNGDFGSIQKPGIKNYAKPEYPSNLRRRNIEGEVIVSLRVDEEGQVQNLKIYKSSGYDSFDQSALNAISNWKFKAAEKDGNQVAVIVNLPIRFKLN
ncbi:energy transducer TonB [Halanaerobium saccharolyticum]|nr:energy transducer TonB [Halanaerobium saccharolyticum]